MTGGAAEVTVQWTDERTRLACKARPDYVQGDTLVHFKTARDAGERFAGDAVRYSYPLTFAFYARGWQALTGRRPTQLVVVAESEPPHDVVVYRVAADVLEYGESQVATALSLVASCGDADDWPGVARDDVLDLTLPSWIAPAPETEPITIGGVALEVN